VCALPAREWGSGGDDWQDRFLELDFEGRLIVGLNPFKEFIKGNFVALDAAFGAVFVFQIADVFVKIVGFDCFGGQGAVAGTNPI